MGVARTLSCPAVHRDIKPKNVLISQKMSNGAVRAMISDFGLCRKLPSGQASYTARSGVTGTEGWIAPEILKQSGRVVRSYVWSSHNGTMRGQKETWGYL